VAREGVGGRGYGRWAGGEVGEGAVVILGIKKKSASITLHTRAVHARALMNAGNVPFWSCLFFLLFF
jgi:hypothetical protein